MSSVGFQHHRDILREMLSVTVKSYCIGKTCIQSISESSLECSALTLIDFQFYDYRLHRHCIQKAH